MMTKKDKQDNEVYFLGSDATPDNGKRTGTKAKWFIFLGGVLLMIAVGISIYLLTKKEAPDYYFEPEGTTEQSVSIVINDSIGSTLEEKAYMEVREENVNDVPLRISIPYHAALSLELGMPDKADSTILYAAMAADIRQDNKAIVGDFVLNGERLSRGVAKKGFAAIESNKITIGMGDSTPLLEQVIQNGGSFFRQYALVNNGELVENKPKGKSIRRSLAVLNEQIVMIESRNRESFHDFSQALIDAGVTDAIYLVGGSAYGWYRNKEHVRHEFGEEQTDLPENISYIVWR